MTQQPPDRLDRIEASLERTSLLERLINVQGNFLTTQEQHQQRLAQHEQRIAQNDRILANHDALLQRLDAILERLVYREGREGTEDGP